MGARSCSGACEDQGSRQVPEAKGMGGHSLAVSGPASQHWGVLGWAWGAWGGGWAAARAGCVQANSGHVCPFARARGGCILRT